MYKQHIYTPVYYSVQHGEHAYILGVNTAPACANYSVQYLELGRGWGVVSCIYKVRIKPWLNHDLSHQNCLLPPVGVQWHTQSLCCTISSSNTSYSTLCCQMQC